MKPKATPRVLLVSGIFFPDVGGPSTHARKIAEHFYDLGWLVTVVAFGEKESGHERYRVVRISRRQPRVFSWLFYALSIFWETPKHDCVYAFDLTTAGLPSALASAIFFRPFLLRIGGDPLWEREVERKKRFLPLVQYYEQGLHRRDWPLRFLLLRFVARRAQRIVVYNRMFSDFYSRNFAVSPERIGVIQNPFPKKRNSVRETGSFTCVFAGRFVSYKNLSMVIRSAADVIKSHPELKLVFVGEGPEEKALIKEAHSLGVPLEIKAKMNQEDLFDLIRRSSLALAPALTEFNPNFILEALSMGKPVLISKGHGLSTTLPDYFEFDPMDKKSLVEALQRMVDPKLYEKALRCVEDIKMDQTWDGVLREHESIVKKALNL